MEEQSNTIMTSEPQETLNIFAVDRSGSMQNTNLQQERNIHFDHQGGHEPFLQLLKEHGIHISDNFLVSAKTEDISETRVTPNGLSDQTQMLKIKQILTQNGAFNVTFPKNGTLAKNLEGDPITCNWAGGAWGRQIADGKKEKWLAIYLTEELLREEIHAKLKDGERTFFHYFCWDTRESIKELPDDPVPLMLTKDSVFPSLDHTLAIPRGNTALRDAQMKAISYAKRFQQARKVLGQPPVKIQIFVVTDGGENASQTSSAALLKATSTFKANGGIIRRIGSGGHSMEQAAAQGLTYEESIHVGDMSNVTQFRTAARAQYRGASTGMAIPRSARQISAGYAGQPHPVPRTAPAAPSPLRRQQAIPAVASVPWQGCPKHPNQ